MHLALVVDRCSPEDPAPLASEVLLRDAAATAAALRRAGHEVSTWSGLAPPVADPALGRGLRVWPGREHTDVGGAVQRARDLGAWLRESWADLPQGPDAVVATTWCAGAAALVAGGRDRPPVAVAATAPRPGDPSASVQHAVLLGADLVLVPSEQDLAGVLAAGVDRRAVGVVPPGVEAGDFPEAMPRPSDDRVVVLCEGSADEASGVPGLVRALRLVPEAQLQVLGAEPGYVQRVEVPSVHALAQRHGVGARVRGLGLVAHAEMPEVLAGVDVVAHVPRGGGGGRLVLEAMASARPVLVADSGPLADVVSDPSCGVLVPPGDETALATALRSLVRNPFSRQALGQSGRDRVLARYTWDRVAADLLRVLARQAPAALPGAGAAPESASA